MKCDGSSTDQLCGIQALLLMFSNCDDEVQLRGVCSEMARVSKVGSSDLKLSELLLSLKRESVYRHYELGYLN